MMTPLSEPGIGKIERKCGKNRKYSRLYAIYLVSITRMSGEQGAIQPGFIPL
jgi:hypothetical protein